MFRENADGSISWFNIDETYRWGQGFIEEDLDCNLPWQGDDVAYARADAGWGCEFDDSCSIEWEFSDDILELEQQELKELYYEGGSGWLYDGEHDWQEEDAAVHIIAPYQVDLCEDDGKLIIFGKNDQKIENFNQSRTSANLSRYLDVEELEEA
jgi:hypothetical protein